MKKTMYHKITIIQCSIYKSQQFLSSDEMKSDGCKKSTTSWAIFSNHPFNYGVEIIEKSISIKLKTVRNNIIFNNY